jgi:hypothetical protein
VSKSFVVFVRLAQESPAKIVTTLQAVSANWRRRLGELALLTVIGVRAIYYVKRISLIFLKFSILIQGNQQKADRNFVVFCKLFVIYSIMRFQFSVAFHCTVSFLIVKEIVHKSPFNEDLVTLVFPAKKEELWYLTYSV